MRFYKQPHAFYAGVDLHARSMFTHILDSAGATVFERNVPANPDAFRNAIAPFRTLAKNASVARRRPYRCWKRRSAARCITSCASSRRSTPNASSRAKNKHAKNINVSPPEMPIMNSS